MINVVNFYGFYYPGHKSDIFNNHNSKSNDFNFGINYGFKTYPFSDLFSLNMCNSILFLLTKEINNNWNKSLITNLYYATIRVRMF